MLGHPKHRATRWGGPRGGPSPSACSSTVLIPVSLGLCLVHELGLRSSRCPPVILERRPGSLPVPQFPPDLAQRQPTAACPRPRCPHVSSGGPSPQQQPAKHREARGKEENSQSKKKKKTPTKHNSPSPEHVGQSSGPCRKAQSNLKFQESSDLATCTPQGPRHEPGQGLLPTLLLLPRVWVSAAGGGHGAW